MHSVDSCFMLPVQQHKDGNARDLWDDLSEKYGADIDGYLKLLNIERALVFLQTIPDRGDFLVMYLRSRDDLQTTLTGLFTKNLKCPKYLAAQFKDITGVDLSRPENFPEPERLMSWTDDKGYIEERKMLKMPWCFAVPVRQGKTDSARKFIGDMAAGGDMAQMFRKHDIVQRLAFLQHTGKGDFIVQYMLASNTLDDLMLSMNTCNHESCSTMKKSVMDFSGIDFSDQKNVPNVNLLFKWDSSLGFQTAEQTIAYTE